MASADDWLRMRGVWMVVRSSGRPETYRGGMVPHRGPTNMPRIRETVLTPLSSLRHRPPPLLMTIGIGQAGSAPGPNVLGGGPAGFYGAVRAA